MKTRANFIVRKKRTFPSSMIALFMVAAAAWTQWPAHHPVVKQELKAEVKPVAAPVIQASQMTSALDQLEKIFRSQKILGLNSFERENATHSARITLDSDALFEPGCAQLKAHALSTIYQMVHHLKLANAIGSIEIEGHTDPTPEQKSKVVYHTNWGLSAARAAILVPYFSRAGFIKSHLSAVGYGDSRPIHSSKNRRIVLRVFTGDEGRM